MEFSSKHHTPAFRPQLMSSEPQSEQRQQIRSTADDSPPHKLPRKRPLEEEIDIGSPEKDKVNLASSSSAWPSNKSPRHARQRSASIASIHSILSAKLEPPAMLGNAALPSSPKTCSYHDGPFAVLGGFEDIPFLITRALLTDYPRGTIVVLHSETRLILQDDTLPLIAGPVCMSKCPIQSYYLVFTHIKFKCLGLYLNFSKAVKRALCYILYQRMDVSLRSLLRSSKRLEFLCRSSFLYSFSYTACRAWLYSSLLLNMRACFAIHSQVTNASSHKIIVIFVFSRLRTFS